MEIKSTPISGLSILEPRVICDNRGLFFEAYNESEFHKAGICYHFVQDNQSTSVKNVLRGVHVQRNFPQAKLARVISGVIWDVSVDMRRESPTFGKWFGVELSAQNKRQILIPENFAHGFYTLSDEAEVLYKVTTHFHSGDEIGFIWNDKDINIQWPIPKGIRPILADKDLNWKTFKETFLNI